MESVNSNFEETALSLDPHRRAQLAAALIKSLEPSEVDAIDSAQVEGLWLKEVENRVARYRAGEVELVPWEDVKERLHSRRK